MKCTSNNEMIKKCDLKIINSPIIHRIDKKKFGDFNRG